MTIRVPCACMYYLYECWNCCCQFLELSLQSLHSFPSVITKAFNMVYCVILQCLLRISMMLIDANPASVASYYSTDNSLFIFHALFFILLFIRVSNNNFQSAILWFTFCVSLEGMTFFDIPLSHKVYQLHQIQLQLTTILMCSTPNVTIEVWPTTTNLHI